MPHENCPFCHPKNKPLDPWRESQCVMHKPLMMVIPPGGVHLDCPVHPEGHHIHGPQAWLAQNIDYSHDPSKDLTYDSTRPFGTATGFTGWDTNKFSM
jgi:hypothetical protein